MPCNPLPTMHSGLRQPCAALCLAVLLVAGNGWGSTPVPVQQHSDGRLVYQADARGNRIPDFSHCGYRGGNEPIPLVPVRIVVAPAAGDDRHRLQAAIDYLASQPRDDQGFRGAVLLQRGQYEVNGQLKISASGIVLRGMGMGTDGTTILATGRDRRTLIVVCGTDDREMIASQQSVTNDYVPVGATSLRLRSTQDLQVGDTVIITRPSTRRWIADLGMDSFGINWKPGTRDLHWDRTITAIDDSQIEIDAPITTALDQQYGGGSVQPYRWPGRLEQVGIENLCLQSQVEPDNPLDEEHAWHGITLQGVRNGWVRRVSFRHFAGGAVALWEHASQITVSDCKAYEPISELAGYRRHTFFTMGQQTLFLRCWSQFGRHDFAAGHAAAGPNAFVTCVADQAHDNSGPLESWAAGVLYDNVRIDGADLDLANRHTAAQGAGWAAANSVLWQCRAATVRCFRPPTANNWAVGVWSEMVGDGQWFHRNEFVGPLSLYQAQLRDRLGEEAAARVGPFPWQPEGATNPSYQEAAEFVQASNTEGPSLKEIIDRHVAEHPLPLDHTGAVPLESVLPPETPVSSSTAESTPAGKLVLQNGWLTVNGQLVVGDHLEPIWWRGTIRPEEAPQSGPAVTRFVPGRVGTGFTDDLNRVTDRLRAQGIAVLDHHHGLWYDRRRDDHQMIRRANAAGATPPFLEQPFARSGQGTAWDGLSRYDLTRFNPWYWNRLQQFAAHCDQKGLVLIHQNYFQHNVLEAGAHWADFPWRSANNINSTGFPEPPPYVGDKRIFQAHLFYDVMHPERRRLHRNYIRQCLEAFAEQHNVIQMTAAEYTGPLAFMQFWIDTIVQWKNDRQRDVLIGLSCTKEVQDAILADPDRGPHVSIIDIRYWTYTGNGTLYAPPGGENLSPRQHLRQQRPAANSFASVVRSVREYRRRFPHKAVTYYADLHCRGQRPGWAVLLGGGSLPNLPGLEAGLRAALPRMQPADHIAPGPARWCLAHPGRDYLIYTTSTEQPLVLDLRDARGSLTGYWIDPATCRTVQQISIKGAQQVTLPAVSHVLWLTRTAE